MTSCSPSSDATSVNLPIGVDTTRDAVMAELVFDLTFIYDLH